jgi:hypothetical protein
MLKIERKTIIQHHYHRATATATSIPIFIKSKSVKKRREEKKENCTSLRPWITTHLAPKVSKVPTGGKGYRYAGSLHNGFQIRKTI